MKDRQSQDVLSNNQKKELQALIKSYQNLPKIIQAIAHAGGIPYVVGGAVRDLLLGKSIKDLDIEVHGISLDRLEQALKEFGVVNLVGKAYGVLRVGKLDIDWSVPRIDSSGRKPAVEFLTDNASALQAFARRDLTVNSMGIDLLTYELVDPFNGYADLRAGVLRATSPEKFVEDPLRFYRVMQFMARFAMNPDAQLNDICRSIDISAVSQERIWQEFKKWLLQSKKPSLALQWLDSLGRLAELFPEIAALKGVEQNPAWHPEGDVFEHTKQALDAAADIECESNDEKLLLMYAVLCHDLGKAVTTKENERGDIISYEHDQEGKALARRLMNRITNQHDFVAKVEKLVGTHMMPGQFVAQHSTPAAYRRLAYKLGAELSLELLAKLFLADCLGRNPKKGQPLTGSVPEVDEFVRKAECAGVLHHPEAPLLQAHDLMPDIKPGPQLGMLLKQAYRLQIDEGIRDKEVLKQRVLGAHRD